MEDFPDRFCPTSQLLQSPTIFPCYFCLPVSKSLHLLFVRSSTTDFSCTLFCWHHQGLLYPHSPSDNLTSQFLESLKSRDFYLYVILVTYAQTYTKEPTIAKNCSNLELFTSSFPFSQPHHHNTCSSGDRLLVLLLSCWSPWALSFLLTQHGAEHGLWVWISPWFVSVPILLCAFWRTSSFASVQQTYNKVSIL